MKHDQGVGLKDLDAEDVERHAGKAGGEALEVERDGIRYGAGQRRHQDEKPDREGGRTEAATAESKQHDAGKHDDHRESLNQETLCPTPERKHAEAEEDYRDAGQIAAPCSSPNPSPVRPQEKGAAHGHEHPMPRVRINPPGTDQSTMTGA